MRIEPTTGPWKAVRATFNSHLWSQFIVDTDGHIIAQLPFANAVQSANEVLSNATLLAAAPMLLASLRELTDAQEFPNAPCHNGLSTMEDCVRCSKHRRARAVIAEATKQLAWGSGASIGTIVSK